VTVLDALSELSDQLEDRGAELWIASLDPEVLAVARRTTWWAGWEAAGRVHPDAATAIAAFRGPGDGGG
jgi:sulfate permease, SulP family